MKNTSPLLEMRGICKSFGGKAALKNAELELYPGQVLALAGGNGAGKSTLMKILSGIYTADSGEIRLYGRKTEINSIKASRKAGIRIIHQETDMINSLTAAQNIFAGREKIKYGFIIDDRKAIKEAEKLSASLGISIDPEKRAGSLTAGQKQAVLLARAVSENCRILILDEPTASLSPSETEKLFGIIKTLKSKGMGIIYISHRTEEILSISDKITVLREGENAGAMLTAETDREKIIKLSAGRSISGKEKKENRVNKNAPVLLQVKNLKPYGTGKNISFSLKSGEIIGLAGLMGAGRTETARAISGADRKTGEIFIKGKRVSIKNPGDGIKNGICYLPEDRKKSGIFPGKSLSENILLPSLEKFTAGGFLKADEMKAASEKIIRLLNIRAASPDQEISTLSGGNQQKAIIGRWLLKDSDIFILDEPQRGIDEAGKEEIFRITEGLAEQGKAVLLISSEFSLIRRLSDRVLIMCDGEITAELDIKDASEEKITEYALSGRKQNEG